MRRTAVLVFHVHTLLSLLAVLACGACGSDGLDPVDPNSASFSDVQAAVLTPSCALAGCHDARSAEAGQVLAAGQAHASLVGVRSTEVPSRFRVEPGFPERSFLVIKLRGGPDLVQARMPLNAPPLSEDRIRLIERWIAAGARDD